MHPFLEGPCLASELARLVEGTLKHGDVELRGVAALEEAGPDALAYCDKRRLPDGLTAGVVLTAHPVEQPCIVVADPLRAFARVLRERVEAPVPAGVHPTAVVHPGAWVHPTAHVGALCVLEDGVVVGAHTVLAPRVVLCADTVVGAWCRIGPGAVLGAAGFRLAAGPAGPERVPQLGRVVLEDGVQVGALTCIDRAFLGHTRVRAGACLDNLVQVAHNVEVGPGAVIAAQAGLAGSVVVGAGAQLGGQVGVADHRRIGAGARVGAQSGVARDVPDAETVLGTPAMPARIVRRLWARWRREGRARRG